jgi:hypothetical protein
LNGGGVEKLDAKNVIIATGEFLACSSWLVVLLVC